MYAYVVIRALLFLKECMQYGHSFTIKLMGSLLCEEDWLSCPSTPDDQCHQSRHIQNIEKCSDSSKEECLEALKICLEKESRYMPKPGYARQLQSNHDLMSARFRAVQWLIKSCIRMNLPFGIFFSAVNYLDRFMSVNPCKGWNPQMVELLSVSCLSVASKFSETSVPSLREIQMDGLDHSFDASMIQRMELKLLQELGWQMNSPTSYSYLEILLPLLDIEYSFLTFQLHKDQLTNRATELLLGALSDVKLMEYQPSTLAVSSLWCSLEDYAPSKSKILLANITNLFNQDQKDADLVKCRSVIVETKPINQLYSLIGRGGAYHCPSSPVTVLLKDQIDDTPHDCIFDLAIRTRPCSNMDLNPVNKKKPRI